MFEAGDIHYVLTKPEFQLGGPKLLCLSPCVEQHNSYHSYGKSNDTDETKMETSSSACIE